MEATAGARQGAGGNRVYLAGLAASAALGGLLFGFDVAIISGAGPFIERHFGLDHLALGWAFSSLLFGCVLGAAFAGPAVERLGRRPVMIAVAFLFAATTVWTGAAGDFGGFVLARFAGGLAVGAVSLVAPMYVAEIAPAEMRGRLGTLYQLSIVIGILVSYLINYALRNTGDDAWRYMFYTGVAPAALFFILMLAAPESPRYLVKTGKLDLARLVLARISGDTRAEAEIKAIADSQSEQPPLLTMLRRINVMRPLIVSFMLAILIHVSGINTVIDYAPKIFKSAGFTMDAALFSTFVLGVTNFAFTLVSFWTIDRFGRRALYIVGSIGMGVTLAALTVAALIGAFSGVIVLGLIMLYLAFFASCIGPVFWTLVPEIFPNSVRGAAMTVPVLTQWVANAVVVLFFPSVFAAAGQAATFGLLAAACIAQAAFTHVFVPETKNRSLEEIEGLWR